jgi:hypothetical protein
MSWSTEHAGVETPDPLFPDCHAVETVTFDLPGIHRLIERADVFVEFGCADGRLMQGLIEEFPAKTFIGFDAPVLIRLAQNRIHGGCFFEDWDLLTGMVRAEQAAGRIVCVILSSSIREVFGHRDTGSGRAVDSGTLCRLFDLVAKPAGTPVLMAG